MNIRKLVYTGLLVAVGVLLPQVFHIFGSSAAGMVFLPMHIPVLIGGLLLGPMSGLCIGVAAPLISFGITGMPPLSNLFFMMLELAAYGFFSGLFYKKLPIYLSLILAMVAGRLVNLACLLFAGWVLQLPVQGPGYVWTAVITGLPGIFLQLLIIPALVMQLKKVVK
jgi:riboflavin transporter FmnP